MKDCGPSAESVSGSRAAIGQDGQYRLWSISTTTGHASTIIMKTASPAWAGPFRQESRVSRQAPQRPQVALYLLRGLGDRCALRVKAVPKQGAALDGTRKRCFR